MLYNTGPLADDAKVIVRIAAALGLVVLGLWLLSALAMGVTHSLAAIFGRLWWLAWWLQHFGLGVLIGFVLGVVCCFVVLARVGRLERA
jgi:hypothetical protein